MNPQCSGQHRAHLAGQHDHSPCVDCGTEHPTGELWIYPHGYVCDACHHGHLLAEEISHEVKNTHCPSIGALTGGSSANNEINEMLGRPEHVAKVNYSLFQLGIDLMRAQAAEWRGET